MTQTKTKNPTLVEILASQGDLPLTTAEKIAKQDNDGTFGADEDPISAIIVNAMNACTENEITDYHEITVDLSYAINQLTRAKEFIESKLKNI